MKRQTGVKLKRSTELAVLNEKRAPGVFTFPNGDRYEGEYKLQPERFVLVKEGHGVYLTNDFSKYECEWLDDRIADNGVTICHSNGTRYKGGIANGEMYGEGAYTFPDGASVEAIWFENKPFTDILFREPRGFAWFAESVTGNEIWFRPENYFWREACETSPTGSTSTVHGSQEELNG